MPSRWAGGLSGVAATALVASLLSACSPASNPSPADAASEQAPAASGPPDSSGAPPAPQTPEPANPVNLTSNVKHGATGVKVDTLVSVRATAGQISKVTLAYRGPDRRGRTVTGSVKGTLNKDRTSWTAADRLEPGTKYSLSMTGKNPDNQLTKKSATFRTQNLTLDEQTFPSIYPFPNSDVGIGMPVILTFDLPVKNRAEFEKNLHVSASPAQPGTWRWYSSREVRYRPKNYWRPGTKVTVHAKINGVDAGDGIYGQQSRSTSFSVRRSLITKVNLDTHRAAVYRNGQKIRTIPISAGKPGWETRSGTKLIMSKEYTHRMTNEMIGAEETYDLNVRYAMRITGSGEFLHAAPWNTGNFGRYNASHGCVGMSTANAAWLFSQVLIGDPVVTVGSKRRVEDGNGYSDWNLSYARYAKGSAL
jgi:lipoprotein-anchoring transpeptidase ErfK/SrfK